MFLLTELNPAEHGLQLRTGHGFHTITLASGERAIVAFTTKEGARNYTSRKGLSGWLPFRLEPLLGLEGLIGPLRTAGITSIAVDPPATGEPMVTDFGARSAEGSQIGVRSQRAWLPSRIGRARDSAHPSAASHASVCVGARVTIFSSPRWQYTCQTTRSPF
ncbi:MAG: hypothetical protein HYS13_17545 [Planctomycetia bacterium]|nr:hypothetical protein [Planctomycetia bacterium]